LVVVVLSLFTTITISIGIIYDRVDVLRGRIRYILIIYKCVFMLKLRVIVF